jgi:hypothetical protein
VREDGISGDELLAFINQDTSVRPDGSSGLGLFHYLRSLAGTGEKGSQREVIANVFGGVQNRMVSGYLLRDIVNKINSIHFSASEEIHTLSHLYESMLREMRDAAGDSGEFYTPRPVVRFMVQVTDPRLGETLHDPACGTGGFLVESFDHLTGQVKTPEDRRTLQLYAAVRPSDVLSYTIPLPPLAVQLAIATRLDTVAEKARQVAAKLDFIEANAAAFVVSQHYTLVGKRIVRLGDILELHEVPEIVVPDGTYPQVGVKGFGGGLFAKPAIAGTETTYRSFNRLYTNALVLSQVKGWEGALAICPKELDGMFVSPEYRTFRCREGLCAPEYISELVRNSWFWQQLQDATRGVGARRERTRPEQFLALEIPMPAIDRQIMGAETISRLAQMKAKHAAIRKDLDALLPSMLERIFQPERCSP